MSPAKKAAAKKAPAKKAPAAKKAAAKKAPVKKAAAKPAAKAEPKVEPEVEPVEAAGPVTFEDRLAPPVTPEDQTARLLNKAESAEFIHELTKYLDAMSEGVAHDEQRFSELNDSIGVDKARIADVRRSLATATEYHTSSFQEAPSW